MEIWADVDEIKGRVRYGHIEGEVNFSKEEEKDFQTLLKKEIEYEKLTEEEQERLDNYKIDIKESCGLVIDDWDIDYWTGIDWNDLLE